MLLGNFYSSEYKSRFIRKILKDKSLRTSVGTKPRNRKQRLAIALSELQRGTAKLK